MAIRRGKFIVELDEPVVLFIVSGQVNNWLKIYRWFYIPINFLRMVYWLHRHPESGCLNGHVYLRIFPFGMLLLSYWRSWDDLEAFARGKDGTHLASWQRYFRDADDSMAIWHETYLVEPGKFEAVYGNIGPYALGKVGRIETPKGRKHNGRGRLNPEDASVSDEPLIPLPYNEDQL